MTQRRDRDRWPRRALRPLAFLALATALAAVPTITFAGAGAAAIPAATPVSTTAVTAATTPDLGPNVVVFDPSMPQAEIQAKVDAVAAQQVTNEMGSARYALLFAPGTYGSAEHPLNFQVGYYTEVAGLGQSPGDVVVNGSIYVRNQCSASGCIALNNFWRSMSNLTQREHAGLRVLQRPVLGRVAGGTTAPGARQGPDDADGLLHRAIVRQWGLHR